MDGSWYLISGISNELTDEVPYLIFNYVSFFIILLSFIYEINNKTALLNIYFLIDYQVSFKLHRYNNVKFYY